MARWLFEQGQVTTGTEKNEMAAVAWGSLILAEALAGLGQGDGPEARSALLRAATLAEQLGLVPLADRLTVLQNLK